MTTPTYPFGSDGWGTDIDDTVEIRAVGPFPVDPWREFPVWKLTVGNLVGRVSLYDTRPPAWSVRILDRKDHEVRNLGWAFTAAEGKAAVEQALGELAAES